MIQSQERGMMMNKIMLKRWMLAAISFAGLIVGVQSMAHVQGVAKPQVLLNEIVQGMPRGEKQEVSVLTASFKPGDKTVFHTHRFPVVVYVLEGVFTLEMEGREPVTIKTGHALIEPENVKMTGYNRSAGPLKVVIFYNAEPGTPFLDLLPE
jgi:quercetin dioxygenase-like cupin family protein